MKKLSSMIVVALFAMALTGCTVRLVDFTALSSKNCEIPGNRGERVQGKDMKWIIFMFPTGVANIKEAVDRAIERCNGDLLVDGVVYQKGWWALVAGQSGFVVEGTCVNTKRK